jgi:hypothetical protein
VIFLLTKFVEGAWVVVVAVPLFIVLFNRVEAYYGRAGREMGIGVIPPHPGRRHTLVVVPITNVSRLTQQALSEAISLSDDVIAVTVVFDGDSAGLPQADVERQWRQWNPGVELRVLHTDYASIVRPIVRLVDELLSEHHCQVVVLIPVVIPDRLRYRLLHNQADLALASALRRRPDVVVARVPMPIRPRAPLGDSGDDNTAGTAAHP